MQTKFSGEIDEVSTDGCRLTVRGSGHVPRKRDVVNDIEGVDARNAGVVDEIKVNFAIDVAYTPENAQQFYVGRDVTVSIEPDVSTK